MRARELPSFFFAFCLYKAKLMILKALHISALRAADIPSSACNAIHRREKRSCRRSVVERWYDEAMRWSSRKMANMKKWESDSGLSLMAGHSIFSNVQTMQSSARNRFSSSHPNNEAAMPFMANMLQRRLYWWLLSWKIERLYSYCVEWKMRSIHECLLTYSSSSYTSYTSSSSSFCFVECSFWGNGKVFMKMQGVCCCWEIVNIYIDTKNYATYIHTYIFLEYFGFKFMFTKQK